MAHIINVPSSSRLPDIEYWVQRFKVLSKSSGKTYIVGQNREGRYWGCDCRGWTTHRNCKHLKSLNLPCDSQPHEAVVTSENSNDVLTFQAAPEVVPEPVIPTCTYTQDPFGAGSPRRKIRLE